MSVELREVTRENLAAVLRLEVAPAQRGLVASTAASIAQAHLHPDVAWFRAIYADDVPVGFVMLELEPDQEPFLWRLLIADGHQRRGAGREALALVAAWLRRCHPSSTSLLTSHVVGDGDPGPFYERLGFQYTGESDENGERIMRLPLRSP